MPRKKTNLTIPVLPLRGMMLFPKMVLHVDVLRSKSVEALQQALIDDQQLFLVAQKDVEVEDPQIEDLCPIGTVVTVRQVMTLPEDKLRVLVEGDSRGELIALKQMEPYMIGRIHLPKVEKPDDDMKTEATVRATHDIFDEYAQLSQRVSPENVASIRQVEDPEYLADLIAANILTRLEDKQQILEELDPLLRLEKLCVILKHEIELINVEMQVHTAVQNMMDKNNREHYLREQIRVIQEQLGNSDGTATEELHARAEKMPLNDEARECVKKELDRLASMTPGSPEISVSRTYIEWILDLPWGEETADNLDLKRARTILSQEHYGLDKVKERIVEYLAVLQLKQNMRGPILCFVGPPGVGKTSIVRAIAKAVGRKFVQVSLGGVRDEAEIRGHRRTYIGAIPGRIISGMKQAGTMNPVFLFDEIDKMSNDFRGDPASAMLEVLDAEQNNTFRDHYLDLPFDLSRVMFITTANSIDTIPAPLLDRMEVIEVPSYTEEEKLQIAKRHLLPKQLELHGLEKGKVKISDRVMRGIIEGYTREAGVRTLERTIGQVVRRAAVTMLEENRQEITVTEKVMQKYLGAARFTREMPEKKPRVGIVNGLAYTTVGGELLEVECLTMPGKGALHLTGKLGDVMKESAEAAFTYVRAHCAELGLKDDFYQKLDIHIHVPEGAVPKDGPSAGVTMTTAIVSVLTGIPVRNDVAMTGEITLRGRVLPIGGLKEKAMAAYRAGIGTLIIPEENQKDLEEIPSHILSQFHIVCASQIDEVLAQALVRQPEPQAETEE